MSNRGWYAVKTLYRTTAVGRAAKRDEHYDADATLVEERVVLFLAGSFEQAIDRAEKEAERYASGTAYENPYGQRVKREFLGACDAFHLGQEPGDGREVYSRTEIVEKKASPKTIAHRLLGESEPEDGDPRRRMFLPG